MTWKPIHTAPTAGGDHFPPFHFGPWILIRNPQHEARARWRSSVTHWDGVSDNKTAPARWDDRDGNPIPFDPTEWSPIDG